MILLKIPPGKRLTQIQLLHSISRIYNISLLMCCKYMCSCSMELLFVHAISLHRFRCFPITKFHKQCNCVTKASRAGWSIVMKWRCLDCKHINYSEALSGCKQQTRAAQRIPLKSNAIIPCWFSNCIYWEQKTSRM